MMTRHAWLIAAALACVPLSAHAQVSRVSLDAVLAADGDAGSSVARKPTSWIDVFGAVRLIEGLDLRVRPVIFRRSFDGQWRTRMYELALRFERPGRVGLRLDAGQMSSPIGLSMLENRPDVNPVISQHSTLYLPVPRFEAGTPTTYLLAAAYPMGAQVSASMQTWDARVAVVDSSPIRGRSMMGQSERPRLANLVVGGGITPRVGLRLGASIAHGGYAASTEVQNPSAGTRDATIRQVEGEWSFGYTRIAGEYLWTRREMAVASARVDGGWIEATQTLSPRWFTAARYDYQHTSWTIPSGAASHEPYQRVEATAGLRLTPDVTLRGSYLTRHGYVVSFWDDQVLASIVWAYKFR